MNFGGGDYVGNRQHHAAYQHGPYLNHSSGVAAQNSSKMAIMSHSHGRHRSHLPMAGYIPKPYLIIDACSLRDAQATSAHFRGGDYIDKQHNMAYRDESDFSDSRAAQKSSETIESHAQYRHHGYHLPRVMNGVSARPYNNAQEFD